MPGACCQREGQDAGNCVRIIVKGFIEVPDTEQENDARVLALQPGVLLEKAWLHLAGIPCFTAFAPRSDNDGDSGLLQFNNNPKDA